MWRPFGYSKGRSIEKVRLRTFSCREWTERCFYAKERLIKGDQPLRIARRGGIVIQWLCQKAAEFLFEAALGHIGVAEIADTVAFNGGFHYVVHLSPVFKFTFLFPFQQGPGIRFGEFKNRQFGSVHAGE